MKLKPNEMTNLMNAQETIKACIYFPMHLWLLPMALVWCVYLGRISEVDANYLAYACGAIFMLSFCFSFYRKGYDNYADRPFQNTLIVIGAYLVLFLLDYIVSIVITPLLPSENLNNENIVDLAVVNNGKMFAMAVFIAPVLEEGLFRGCIFSLFYKRSRVWAYVISVAFFSLYHVYAYALLNPAYLLYLVVYAPSAFMLCLCYEWTDSIWGSIFLHMIVNAIAMGALT